MKIKVILLSNFRDIHKEYMSLGNQMENTCGPYTLLYILRGLGFRSHGDVPLSEDYIAYLARTRISMDELRLRKEVYEKLVRGELRVEELDDRYRRVLYRYELPVAKDERELGTSPKGLKYACELITNGTYTCVPLPARKGSTVYFTKERFRELTELLIYKVFEWKYQAILNLQVSKLINFIEPPYDLLEVLTLENPEDVFGLSPLNVGHFVGLAGFIVSEDLKRMYYILRDTYKSIGYHGYHIQPLENVRRALIRDDGREGGILLIVPRDVASDVEAELRKLGLVIDLWDNGTPF